MLLDLFLASVLNIHSLDWSSFGQVFSHAVSLAFLIGYLYMVAKIVKIMVSLELSKKDKIESTHIKTIYKKWLFLRTPIKSTAPTIARFTPEYIMVSDTITCFVLVLSQRNGTI
jgi:hypothetical protein